MADKGQNDGASSSHEIGQGSESTVEINVKTLDSRIFKFSIKKDVPVSVLKAKIATAAAVPEEQQRLIFRGKVLKDDHLLSSYNLEDGDTLHLVARQPVQAQSAAGTGSGESSHPTEGTDSANGASRNRTGQVSHSVLVGTVNIADQGDAMIGDISRVVGAVLQSLGAGVLTPGSVTNNTASANAQVAPNNESGGSRNPDEAANTANQAPPAATFVNQPFQIPQFTPFGGPLRNMVIPDSLTTLLDFINRIELILQNIGNQSSTPVNRQNAPFSENPASSTSLPTPEMLGSVINRVSQLLSVSTARAFAHIAERLQGQASYSDPVIRNQIQAETIQIAQVMQNLGAMLLELGRTTQMLRMGQSAGESFVNTGAAVYISPTGPSPMMVQPFPQMSPLFTSSASIPGMLSGSIGSGDILRNVNIHVVSGPNTGDGSRGQAPNVEQVNQSGRVVGDPASIRGIPGRTVVTAIPGRNPGQPASHVLSVVYPVQVRTQQLVGGTLPTSTQGAAPIRNSGQSSSHNDSTVASVASVASQSVASGVTHFPVANPPSQTSSEVNLVNEQTANAIFENARGLNSQSATIPATGSLSSSSGENNSRTMANLLDNAGFSVPLGSDSSISDRDVQELSGPNLPKADDIRSYHDVDASASNNVKCQASDSNPSTSNNTTSKSSVDLSASHNNDSGAAVPLGLGLGGLQPKKRNKTTKPNGKESSSQESSAPNQSQESISRGKQVLQSLFQGSVSNRGIPNGPSATLPPILSQNVEREAPRGALDAGSMMSQVLQAPAFNNLLTSVAQQTGMGSPNNLRSLMEECARSPGIRDTVNNIVQQVEGQGEDLGSMLLGSGSGEGGIDLSRMIQQMLPVVSQALGGAPVRSVPTTSVESERHFQNSGTSLDNVSSGISLEVNMREARERVEGLDSPGDIFHAVLEGASNLYGDPSNYQDLVNTLEDNSDLCNEYMNMLKHDIRQRVEKQEKFGE